MHLHLSKEFKFEASHQLPYHDGKCARLHGHSWVLTVWISGEVSREESHPKQGMVMDYAELKEVINPIIEMLDHQHFGTGAADPSCPKFYLGPVFHLRKLRFPSVPTSENILIWIASQLPEDFPWECLALNETCTSEARLYARDWAIEKFKKTAQEHAEALRSKDV